MARRGQPEHASVQRRTAGTSRAIDGGRRPIANKPRHGSDETHRNNVQKPLSSASGSRAPVSVPGTTKDPTIEPRPRVTKPPQSQSSVAEESLPKRTAADITRQTVGHSNSQVGSDALQAVAEVFSWVYMTSETVRQHGAMQSSAVQTLETQTNLLREEQAVIHQAKVRAEAEDLLNFVDEIEETPQAAVFFMNFLEYESKSREVIQNSVNSQASRQAQPEIRLLRCNELLDSLGDLRIQNVQIQDHLSDLLISCLLKPGMHSVLQAVMRILQGRAANIAAAETLLTACKANIRTELQFDCLSVPP